MRADQRALELISNHPPTSSYAQLGVHLTDRLRGRLPDYATHMLDSDRIVFCVVAAPEPRIYVEDCEDRTWAIVLHQDLPTLLYRITRAVFSTIGLQLAGETSEAVVNEDDLVQILSNIFWWYGETGLIFGPDYPISEQQIQLANAICVEAETFLLAHEISHVVLYPARGDVLPEELIERLIFGSPGYGPEEATPWEEEFLADAYAVELVMGLAVGSVENIGATNQLRYAGVEWMLVLTKALEALGFPVSTTHPPASDRLESIRSHLRGFIDEDGLYEAIRLFPARFEDVLDRTVAVLVGGATAKLSYEAEAQALVDRLERSLDTAARPSPPNYLGFYDVLSSVLGKGYHHLIIPKLQSLIDRLRPVDPKFCIEIELREKIGHDLSDEERIIAFDYRRFKLIIGFFNRQSNPMGFYMQHYIRGVS